MSVLRRGDAVRLEPPGPEPTGLGRFGEFGGRYAPETLVPALEQLEREFRAAWHDDGFRAEYAALLQSYAGRPTPVTECHRLSERLGVRVLLKREDLTHTGSHKINNVLGQALLTRRMGKARVIAETGAGQHGVATATAAALFGLECTVYMGAVDVERQALNVWRMRLLGADVVPVQSGSATLKDAVNEAMRAWVASVESTHYCLGSAMGPHPFPWMVREFQRVVGDEARRQCRDLLDGADPDVVAACVGGGSNAIGTFAGFFDTRARLVGVEAVVDKDLASSLLARELDADVFVMATDVDGVYRDWGAPTQARIDRATPAELAAMDLPAGSMGPKTIPRIGANGFASSTRATPPAQRSCKGRTKSLCSCFPTREKAASPCCCPIISGCGREASRAEVRILICCAGSPIG